MDQTIITCPSCSRRYAVKANAITGAGRKVRCAGCGHIWVALPDAPVAASLQGGTGGTLSDTPAPPSPPVRATWQGGRPEVSAAPAVERPVAEPQASPDGHEAPKPAVAPSVEAAESKPATPFPGNLAGRSAPGETKARPPVGPRPVAAAHAGAPVPGNFTSLGGVAGTGPRPAGAPYMPRMDTPRRPSGEWSDVTAERVDPRVPGQQGESAKPALASNFSESHLAGPVSFDIDEKPKKRRTALKVLIWLLVLFLAAAAIVFILIQSGVLREAFPSLDRPLPGLGQATPGEGTTGPADSDAGASLSVPSTTSSSTGPESGAQGSSAPPSVIPGGVMPGAFPPAGASGEANTPVPDNSSSGPAAPDLLPATPAN